jgi:hypothetical protein
MLRDRTHINAHATWKHVAIALLWLASTSVHAQDSTLNDAEPALAAGGHNADLGAGETPASRAAIRKIIERETARTNLPADIAEAVVFVESGYNPGTIGAVGEIGLMQVRPETAAMLGFRGNNAELAEPDINIHYGVLYLSRAWRLAGGDLCRALMKYRAGHDEESMTPRSQVYCHRARNRLVSMNSTSLGNQAAAVPDVAPAPTPAPAVSNSARSQKSAHNQKRPAQPKDVYARYRQGTAVASRAYWAAQEARVRLIKARVEAKWKRIASRQ